MLSLSLIILVPACPTAARDCQSESSEFIYSRMFVLSEKGPPAIIANRSVISNRLRTCRSPEDHAKSMMNYFKSYGVNLSSLSINPFEVYEDARVSLRPFVNNPAGNYQVLASTFYEYAESTYAPVSFASWIMSAKIDLTGPKGTLPAVYLAIYGMFR